MPDQIEDSPSPKDTKDNYCSEFGRVIEQKLEAFKKSNVDPEKRFKAAIFSHAYPDPDAIGSMMGVQWILQKAYGIESAMFYAGEVSHPQNNAMINLLDPAMRRVDDEYNASEYNFHVLVDTVPKNAGVGTKEVCFDVVIDHHKDSYLNGFKGFFIHVKAGSCASIVFHMMECLVPESHWLNEDIDADTRVATALLTGIVTDTEYLMSDDSTELEFDAFKKLFEFRNSQSLRDIVFFKRPKVWIDTKAAACTQAKTNEDGVAIVGLGLIAEKQRDMVADMADEMLSWASCETSIAFAVVGGQKIVGCVRSTNASVSVSDLCKRLGGKHGSGGGKQGKGAYQYCLGQMGVDLDDDDDYLQKMWETFKDNEYRRISKLLEK